MRLNHKTLPLGLLLVVGGLLTAALVGFGLMAARMHREEALLQQSFRAEDLAGHLDALLASSEQVLHTLAALASDVRDRQALERLLERMFASTSPAFVDGLGVYFAPYRFAPEQRLMGPYIHWSPDGHPRLTYEWSTPAYDYPQQPWYQGALGREGSAFYTEPYWDDGRVYLSIARTFSDAQGHVLGVVSVDLKQPPLQRLVADAPMEGDLLYVTSPGGALLAHPLERELLAWARAQGRPAKALADLSVEDLRRYEREHGLERTRHTAQHALQRAGWTVYISSDTASLLGGVRRLYALLLLSGGALWAGLLAAALAMRRSLRVEELSRALAEQERVRRTLASSERKLRQVLQTALDGVVAVDAEGRIVEWNARAEEIFGWRQQEALGQCAAQLLVPERDREQRWREHQDVLSQCPKPALCERREFLAVRRDGEEFPVEVSSSAVESEGQRLYYSFFSDITERRRKDEALQGLLGQLRQRTAELHAILDTMLDAVLVIDTECRYTLVNPAARALLGLEAGQGQRLTPEAAIQCGLSRLDGELMPFEELPMVRALRGEVVREADVRITRPMHGGRSLIVRTDAAPIRDERGQVVAAVALAHDVTQALELAQLKDEFLKVAAHELKTPVAVMKSYAQLALKTARELPPGLHRLLEGVGRGADRLDQVIRTLLDASQVHLGSLRFEQEELHLRALLEATAARAAAQHPQHRVLVRPGPDVRVLGDRERLGQVLLELLDNAARYSPPGSLVDVALALEDGEVEVSIRDEGIGIPAERQARIFERFYRAHSGTPHDRGGMGLGLYLAREILRHHGGRLSVASEEGRGTTVHLRLPRQPEAHAPTPPPPLHEERSPA